MKKTSIFVLNAIIALIAIFAIASSFMFPLWKVKFSVTVTPELIDAIRGETDTDSSSEKTDEEELIYYSCTDCGINPDSIILCIDTCFCRKSILEGSKL